MTDDKPNLELIREAADAEKKATPGPWDSYPHGADQGRFELSREAIAAIGETWGDGSPGQLPGEANAQAIAALRNAFPEIVKAVEIYATHLNDCPRGKYGILQPCTCGLDATLAALRGESG